MVLGEWGVGQMLWTFLWFFLFVMWIMLVVTVFADIVRSHDIGGWSKALWALAIIVFPYLGVFIYLIARGGSMHLRAAESERASAAAFQSYIQDAATGASQAEQLEKLANLRASGAITEAEFAQSKARVLAT